MEIFLKRQFVQQGYINYYDTPALTLGFTELNGSAEATALFFGAERVIELEQIHSDIIFLSDHVNGGSEGDGIIVKTPGDMAIIKTADCTPLFFWNHSETAGGVLHIGWRGLQRGIETRLLDALAELDIHPSALHCLLGPSIEKACYEVGPELLEEFSGKPYRSEIFTPIKQNSQSKYLMDVSLGIIRSLERQGAPTNQIHRFPGCTKCESSRFPSYRRAKGTGQRIYNFFMLKG